MSLAHELRNPLNPRKRAAYEFPEAQDGELPPPPPEPHFIQCTCDFLPQRPHLLARNDPSAHLHCAHTYVQASSFVATLPGTAPKKWVCDSWAFKRAKRLRYLTNRLDTERLHIEYEDDPDFDDLEDTEYDEEGEMVFRDERGVIRLMSERQERRMRGQEHKVAVKESYASVRMQVALRDEKGEMLTRTPYELTERDWNLPPQLLVTEDVDGGYGNKGMKVGGPEVEPDEALENMRRLFFSFATGMEDEKILQFHRTVESFMKFRGIERGGLGVKRCGKEKERRDRRRGRMVRTNRGGYRPEEDGN